MKLHELENIYTPTTAIIIYKAEGSRNNADHNEAPDFYLESRVIEGCEIAPVGKPLKRSQMIGIAQAYANDMPMFFSGTIPSNVLHLSTQIGVESLTWFQPPQKRPMFFSEEMGIPDGQAWQPPLLFHAAGRSISVFAMDCATRPEPKTKLFRAPYFNTGGDGHVCMGSAKLPKLSGQSYEDVINKHENVFWKSRFSHLHYGQPTKSNATTLWRELIGTEDEFPLDQLIPSSYTLNQIINKRQDH